MNLVSSYCDPAECIIRGLQDREALAVCCLKVRLPMLGPCS
jgi:hypothetical protein